MAAKKSAKKSASKKPVKKAAKKTTKKAVKKPATKTAAVAETENPSSRFPMIAVVTGVLFVLLVLIVAIVVVNYMTPDTQTTTAQGEVVANVNGQPITTQDVDMIQAALGPQGAFLSEEEIIDQLILQTLLLQEAEVRGIMVTPAEAEAEFEALLAAQGVSREEFAGMLAQQGQDLNMLLEEFRKNLVLEELASQITAEEVTEEQAQQFYQEYAAIAGEDTPSYEELREEIFAFLEEQARAEALTSLAESLESQAQIERY